MNKNKILLLASVLVLLRPAVADAAPVGAPNAPAPAIPANVALPTALELARTDLKGRKTVMLAQNLPLTEAEAAAFWPLRNEYEAELDRLVQRKIELTFRHIKHSEQPTDREAAELVQEHFDLEFKQTALKQKYYKRFAAVLSPVKTARFFQIESLVNHEFALQVEHSLPPVNCGPTP